MNVEFERNVKLNNQNKRVEYNIKTIVKQLMDSGMEQREIANQAGVSPSTVASWVKKERASAAAVDRLVEKLQYSERQSEENDPFSELMSCVKRIKQLGFDVTLRPI